MLYTVLAMLPRSASAVVTSLIVALAGRSPLLGADPSEPAARPASAVRVVLDRAAAPAASQRWKALAEADRAAENARDVAGGLAAAALAENEGQERYRQGELTAAEGLLRRALTLREEFAPDSLAVA